MRFVRHTGLAFLLGALLAAPAAAQVNARMLQQPDVSQTQIAFVYAGDIWVVPKTGGVANRLSTPRGEESFPRFSPDGSKIAFTGDYDGNEDIYVVPADGGSVERITHHPMADRMLDWYPDGKSILYASSMASGRQRYNQLWKVSVAGGLPEKLPVAYGEFGAISPDGTWLAYTTKTRDFRTWKRYRGGWAPDIWLFNLKTYASKNITHSDANETLPMWHGRTLYFLSDADSSERSNIWAYDLDKGQLREVTHYTDYDVHFPAIGPSDIVYEHAGRLYLLDLATEQSHEVHVTVVTDRATLKPRQENVGNLIQAADISPTGQRAVFQARGDLFTVPAEHGAVVDVSQTSGAAERWPTWSPDGKWIAYWTDKPGEYQLAVRPADGSGQEQILTSYKTGFRYTPYWSPDSKKLAFVDQTMTIWIFDRESKKATKVDQALSWYEGALESFRPSWSSDSRWLAYGRDIDNQHTAVFLYDTRDNQAHQVTSGFYNDASPVFDPDGKYLYLLTNRSFAPSYSDLQNTWIYANTTKVAVVPLRTDVPSPLAPRNDEEKAKTEAAKNGGNGNGKSEAKKDTATKAVDIDLAGFEGRLVELPVERGNYTDLYAAPGKIIYRRFPRTGSAGRKSPIVYWDLQDRKEHTILDDANGMILSANGKKLLVAQHGKFAIIDVKPGQKFAKPLATDQMAMTVDPPAEWRQIFTDVWRFDRDFFYDPHMHGVDWNAVRKQYSALLKDAVTRWDVNYVIGEMISELSSSHSYRGGGDLEHAPSRPVGLLGVDWSVDHGAYRIAKIINGAPWDDEVRSPFDESDVDVKVGDYVLAVNGIPLDVREDPWAPFEGLANKTVVLTVNDKPSAEGARQVVVKTMTAREAVRLRHLAWVEHNREYVDSASHGSVGYVYVPDTGIGGQTELVRQFLAQYDKDGLVIDERFNSGGQIPDRFIELLNRPALSFWAVRRNHDWRWPPFGHFGPEVMLINGWSGSGGDAFPYYFKEAKLGPLVGERTWGGLIGISGVPGLIDGGFVTVPTFRLYSPTGKWFPEGHGVEPDIRVVDDPTLMARGHDPQLEAGTAEVLKLMKEHPANHGKRPPYQDRTAKGQAKMRGH